MIKPTNDPISSPPTITAALSSAVRGHWMPNSYDVILMVIILGMFMMIAKIASEMVHPLPPKNTILIVLDPWNLFEYGARTTARMFLAIFASLLFTFMIAPLAAKSKRAERVIIPTLDILQSVPVLGFISFTVVFFLNLFPGSELGAECASIFAIFTAQVWNMTFSFYQSLRTVPKDLSEVCTHLGLSPWMRFWKLEVPFSTPGLVWNAMMSMSAAWFFLVASEAIITNNSRIFLPGIGSWLALAIDQENISAVIWAVSAMGIIIILYNQLIFGPLVVGIDKYKLEETEGQSPAKSWVYDLFQRTNWFKFLTKILEWTSQRLFTISIPPPITPKRPSKGNPHLSKTIDVLWYFLIYSLVIWALWTIYTYITLYLNTSILREAFIGCLYTLMRVLSTLAIASLIWVPIGVWLGLRPWAAQRSKSISQFLAAFPANIFFPFFVIGIVSYNLDPTIWLSPLMMIGAQWYIFFNVIAGTSAFPNDLKEVTAIYRVGNWNWWKKIMLPGIFPFYITGTLTAWGAAWNASIVSEFVSWGPTKLEAIGIGSFIAKASEASDFPRIVLGLTLLSLFVITFNRLLWRRLYTAMDPLQKGGHK